MTSWFYSFDRAAPRTQGNILLTRSPADYKRIQVRNRQMEEMPRVRSGEMSTAAPGTPLSLDVHVFPSLEILKTLSFGFYGGFIT